MNVGKWMSKSISAPVQQTVCSCGNAEGRRAVLYQRETAGTLISWRAAVATNEQQKGRTKVRHKCCSYVRGGLS